MKYNYPYNPNPMIGEVYYMEFSDSQSGCRPGVVLQNNVGNIHSPNLIVLPLTSVIKKTNLPTHVLLPASATGLIRDSMVLCESPETMPKKYVGGYLTKIPDEYMREIARASLLATSAISFLAIDDLQKVWQEAVRLNNCTLPNNA